MRLSEVDGGWRELVTEGHVIAFRLRARQSWLVGLGLLAMALGFWIASSVRPESETAATAADSVVAQVQAPAVNAVAGLPTLSIPSSQINALVPTDALPDLAATLLAGLRRSDALPHDPPTLRRVGFEDFWTKPWRHVVAQNQAEALTVTETPTLKLVGAVLRKEDGGYNRPVRWMGVFSKRSGGWDYLSLNAPGFVVIGGAKWATAAQIPLTLEPVLPASLRPGRS